MASLPTSSLLEKVVKIENLEVSYDQRELLTSIAASLNQLYNVQKPYDYRYIYKHSVLVAHSYERYVFDYPIYQIVVMPTPARIEILLDTDSVPFIIEENESLNITTLANIMAISNAATPAATEEVRIYVFGRKQ